MGGTYAAKTDVTSTKSRDEIEHTLTRYGATHFGYLAEPGRAIVGFQLKNRQFRFAIPLPDPTAREFTHTPTGLIASSSAQKNKYEQSVRQKWRALALVVKAKLEAVESGIAGFEQEFYGYLVLPSGQTVYEQTIDQVDMMIETGMPGRLLLES